jgi:hypothetical protein
LVNQAQVTADVGLLLSDPSRPTRTLKAKNQYWTPVGPVDFSHLKIREKFLAYGSIRSIKAEIGGAPHLTGGDYKNSFGIGVHFSRPR